MKKEITAAAEHAYNEDRDNMPHRQTGDINQPNNNRSNNTPATTDEQTIGGQTMLDWVTQAITMTGLPTFHRTTPSMPDINTNATVPGCF